MLTSNWWYVADPHDGENFCYYSSPIKRAQHIFTGFSGLKFHIWHEGFMPEYESYHIPQAIEDDWRKLF